MKINKDNFEFLVGDFQCLTHAQETPALPTFSALARSFLAALSKELLAGGSAREYVDVISYAYWIRKASLETVKEKHIDREHRLGRGVAFHIAPSNVPVNFAVSMTSSLLAGNITLVRISNKEFEQVNIICDAVNRLLETEFGDMKPYICLFRYQHDENITREISAICDVRVIWGGNRTIGEIRNAPLPPRAVEMAFADRHSIALIDAGEYLTRDAAEVAKGFYTDTYYTDQNACSSPRLVVWFGDKVSEARDRFWKALEDLVKKDYTMQPIQAVDKYMSFCEYAMEGKGIHLVSDNNYVMRVETEQLDAGMMEYKDGGGYFFEYVAQELEEIVPVLTKQCQTVAVLGIEKSAVRNLVFEKGVRGVDRIVELGQTMGLEFIWDGYKMVESMSRFVYTGEYN